VRTGGNKGKEENIKKLQAFVIDTNANNNWHNYYRSQKRTHLDKTAIAKESGIGRTAIYEGHIKDKLIELEEKLRRKGILNYPDDVSKSARQHDMASHAAAGKRASKANSALQKENNKLRILNASLQQENEELKNLLNQKSISDKYMKKTGQIPIFD
jgi:hypothetical protein